MMCYHSKGGRPVLIFRETILTLPVCVWCDQLKSSIFDLKIGPPRVQFISEPSEISVKTKMACAPFVWPRQSALSSTALASWPTPTLPSWPAPSVTLQTQTKEERDKCEDLLDSLILQAAEQKSKEDMMASLHETSGRPNVTKTQLKKPQTSPCRVGGFLTAFLDALASLRPVLFTVQSVSQ